MKGEQATFGSRKIRVIQDVSQIPRLIESQQIPEDYILRFATEEDAQELAKLYGAIFETYPTPMNDERYIKKVMEEGTIFSVIEYEGTIVSAASAEVNEMYHNAELTDCATIPHHRKHGFMKVLISALEQELIQEKHLLLIFIGAIIVNGHERRLSSAGI